MVWAIRAALKEDMKRRADTAVEDVERLLTDPHPLPPRGMEEDEGLV